ncbi:MAG: cation diffusion facilitator family transporter [Pirellulaceae bacterium]
MATGSKKSVIAAIVGNGLVMVAKFAVFFVTGSGAMLSEAIHTLADLLNQILLMVGIVRSDRIPNEVYQYGFKAERYVWALISAVGIFFLGCGVTVYHGIHSLMDPHHLESLGWAVGVLIVSFVVEGIVLYIAVMGVYKDAKGAPFFQYLKNDADPAAVAVVLEDSAACFGILLALAAIMLSQWTGDPRWDAYGSIAIGVLLGLIAVWLIRRNGQLLVGASIPAHLVGQVRTILQQNPAVEEVVDLKTRVLDTETFRIKADVRFNGEALANKLKPGLREDYEKIETYEDFERFTQEFGDEIVDLLADEIDAIEQKIRAQIPQAQHMDIEAD